MKPLALFSMILLLAPLSLRADFSKPGDTGIGAVGQSMGGAHSAVGSDPQDVFLNPADLAGFQKVRLAGTYGGLFSGLEQYLGLSAVSPVDLSSLALGFSTYRLFSTQTGDDQQTWMASFALPLTDSGSSDLGVSLKYLRVDDADPAQAFGLDAGIRGSFSTYRDQTLDLAASLLDVDTVLLHQSGLQEPLPQLYKIGLAYRVPHAVVFALDQDFRTDLRDLGAGGQDATHVGVEKPFWKDRLLARLGYSSLSGSSGRLSLGLGLRWRSLKVDYAFLPSSGDVGASHRLSLDWGWDWRVPAAPAPLSPAASALPAAPVIVQSLGGNGMALLSWREAASTAVRAYRVYVAEGPDSAFKPLADTTFSQTSLQINGLPNGRDRWLRVSALGAGESPLSKAVVVRPEAPSDQVAGLMKRAREESMAGRPDLARTLADQARSLDPLSADAFLLAQRLDALGRQESRDAANPSKGVAP